MVQEPLCEGCVGFSCFLFRLRIPGNEEMNGLSEELLSEVRSEAEYYGISPLVKQLTLCCELNESSCGDVLFYSFLEPPLIPCKPYRYR